ncbi:probable G-protein coupled receptor No9 [Dendronephthya gigantea]|uniref:probable G-protein coupled receptor No9 n=1 Tax=Dendronephthya gigantea TaxID=151771 RepID=UPI001069CAD3|nr:probable G-protein coupled receptor No9 [Dendronephthya gigantea]
MTNTTKSEVIPLTRTYLIALIVLKSFCLICGVLGNFGVMMYNLYTKNDKTPTGYLVANLACADLLTCLTVYPTWIAEFGMILAGEQSDQTFFCKFSYTIARQFICVSTLTLLAITVDRYIYISSPLRYPLIMTWRKTYVILLSIWICASLYSPIVAIYIEPGNVRTMCLEPIAVALIASIIYIVVPMGVIFYCNCKIFRLARGQIRRMHASRVDSNHDTPSASSFTSEMKAIKTFVIVIGVFLLCCVPYAILLLVKSCDCVPDVAIVLLGDLVLANSIMNPIIYGMRQQEYKNFYRQFFFVIRSRLIWVFRGGIA